MKSSDSMTSDPPTTKKRKLQQSTEGIKRVRGNLSMVTNVHREWPTDRAERAARRHAQAIQQKQKVEKAGKSTREEETGSRESLVEYNLCQSPALPSSPEDDKGKVAEEIAKYTAIQQREASSNGVTGGPTSPQTRHSQSRASPKNTQATNEESTTGGAESLPCSTSPEAQGSNPCIKLEKEEMSDLKQHLSSVIDELGSTNEGLKRVSETVETLRLHAERVDIALGLPPLSQPFTTHSTLFNQVEVLSQSLTRLTDMLYPVLQGTRAGGAAGSENIIPTAPFLAGMGNQAAGNDTILSGAPFLAGVGNRVAGGENIVSKTPFLGTKGNRATKVTNKVNTGPFLNRMMENMSGNLLMDAVALNNIHYPILNGLESRTIESHSEKCGNKGKSSKTSERRASGEAANTDTVDKNSGNGGSEETANRNEAGEKSGNMVDITTVVLERVNEKDSSEKSDIEGTKEEVMGDERTVFHGVAEADKIKVSCEGEGRSDTKDKVSPGTEDCDASEISMERREIVPNGSVEETVEKSDGSDKVENEVDTRDQSENNAVDEEDDGTKAKEKECGTEAEGTVVPEGTEEDGQKNNNKEEQTEEDESEKDVDLTLLPPSEVLTYFGFPADSVKSMVTIHNRFFAGQVEPYNSHSTTLLNALCSLCELVEGEKHSYINYVITLLNKLAPSNVWKNYASHGSRYKLNIDAELPYFVKIIRDIMLSKCGTHNMNAINIYISEALQWQNLHYYVSQKEMVIGNSDSGGHGASGLSEHRGGRGGMDNDVIMVGQVGPQLHPQPMEAFSSLYSQMPSQQQPHLLENIAALYARFQQLQQMRQPQFPHPMQTFSSLYSQLQQQQHLQAPHLLDNFTSAFAQQQQPQQTDDPRVQPNLFHMLGLDSDEEDVDDDSRDSVVSVREERNAADYVVAELDDNSLTSHTSHFLAD